MWSGCAIGLNTSNPVIHAEKGTNMKFIHAADLHLDSPFQGLHNDSLPTPLWEQIRQSTFTSFRRIVDGAIDQNVDFVLLAGDLFDRQERSVSARVFLIQQLQRLADARIPVLIIFGNHDYYSGDLKQLGYPDNTSVFGNQVETKKIQLLNGQVVAITGFSFQNQWVNEPMINDYPNAVAADWNIGMLHGSLAGLDSPEANYAPFTLEQLQSKNYDYWALGHIHKRQSLDDKGLINYSGNTQGRHINETGEKGYLLVQSTGHELTTAFQPTSPIVWEVVAMKITDKSVDNLANSIMNALSKQHYSKLHFIRIRLTADQAIPDKILESLASGDLLTAVQQMNTGSWQQLNTWVTSIKAATGSQRIIGSLDQSFFDEAKQQTLTSEQLDQLTQQSLDKYPFIKADLATRNSQQDIFEQTTAILQHHVSGAEDGEASQK